MLDYWGYRHTLRICNAYCFTRATMVSRTHLNVTLVRTLLVLAVVAWEVLWVTSRWIMRLRRRDQGDVMLSVVTEMPYPVSLHRHGTHATVHPSTVRWALDCSYFPARGLYRLRFSRRKWQFQVQSLCCRSRNWNGFTKLFDSFDCLGTELVLWS